MQYYIPFLLQLLQYLIFYSILCLLWASSRGVQAFLPPQAGGSAGRTDEPGAAHVGADKRLVECWLRQYAGDRDELREVHHMRGGWGEQEGYILQKDATIQCICSAI